VRIAFRKVDDDRHELSIVRDDGARESVECETKSLLAHDLLHYAVELEAGLTIGFWGTLAAGATLAQMNDRTRPPPTGAPDELAVVEQFVGALSGTVKGQPPAQVAAGIRRYAAAMGKAEPPWLTEDLVVAVTDRVRRLMGQWRATPRGVEMVLAWGPDAHVQQRLA
jgi:hypothetical protein